MTVVVDCPTCGRKVAFTAANRWRPFCSQRCKTLDLGAWASESYRIAGNASEDGTSSDEGDTSAGRREPGPGARR